MPIPNGNLLCIATCPTFKGGSSSKWDKYSAKVDILLWYLLGAFGNLKYYQLLKSGLRNVLGRPNLNISRYL